MNVSYQWLKEYVSLDGITPEMLADKMSRTGIEVEDVAVLSEGLKKIVVGHVKSRKDHPDSDHLNICQVDIGEAELSQIICGAPNVAEGQKVIVALPGSRIAGNVKIKKGKMRGEVSNGMICSLQELGYSDKVIPKKYAEGIYVLPDNAVPGEEVFSYLMMDDAVLELSITPNRADALSMRGVAHEVGAIYDLPVSFRDNVVMEDAALKIEDFVKVSVSDEEDAPNYNIRIIKDVQIKESPLWLQTKLMNAGIRPLNNIVDITNFILLEYGQPLHAFDYDRLGSKEIHVRRAVQGEKLVTLDGEERMLVPENIVITNGEIPVALAGVMGGLDSEITDQTTTVALETALFNPTAIRITARDLNLRSEASARFEKGINLATMEAACQHALALMVELGGGRVVTGAAEIVTKKPLNKELDITLDRINHILGTEISAEEVIAIFKRLGFGVHHDSGVFMVSVPPRRWDIAIEADLVEEVARIYGYDRLPSTLPTSESFPGGLNEKQHYTRLARRYLEGAGLSQAISYVLTTPEKAGQFMMRTSKATTLAMPMSEERSTLRMNLLSGLLDDVAYNVARKNTDVALYEMGRVFYEGDEGSVLPYEEEHMAGVMTGLSVQNDWHHEKQAVDFFTLKGVVEGLLADYSLTEEITYVADSSHPEMHPGRTAKILLGEKEIGFLGQLHPATQKAYDLKETYVFEINLQAILDEAKAPIVYQVIPKYPGMTRDIALLVDETVTNQQVLEAIEEKGGKLLSDVQLFDVYTGDKIEAGKKSMAYTLNFLNPQATLTDEEVTTVFNKIVKNLESSLSVVVR